MLLLLVSACCLVLSNSEFSGFYKWNRTEPTIAEDYAGAWLVSKQRLLSAEMDIAQSGAIEHGCFAVLRHSCHNCETLFARDYFDFMVEHLSSTTNMFPSNDPTLFNITSNRLFTTVAKLKKQRRAISDERVNSTLAMIVYSSISSTAVPSPEQVKIRYLFLEATFYSIARYFPHIVIVVANESDAITVRQMRLTVMEVITVKVPLSRRQQTELLPRTALAEVLLRVKSDMRWQWVRYVYYTEGDTLLHARSVRQLFSLIDRSNGTYAVVPHRMQVIHVLRGTIPTEFSVQTFPFKLSYPLAVQSLWTRQGSSQPQNLLPPLRNLTLITEDLQRTRGSCCDAGRHVYRPCGTWWYLCPGWGLMNLTSWLRVGRTGFSFPASTEHGAVCRYSAVRETCALPQDCSHRLPTGQGDVCLEMNKVNHYP